mmetsp:Transcript_4591/g.8786  ORF Transcript_4591/g.8786 Transcript_4591/m.8786 type:complete len:344 (-) Transcript_4591:39-1070(-)
MFVESMFIYPVKSCQGIKCSSALLTPYGLQYDRCWAIVDSASRQVENQYDMHPRLATIKTEIVSLVPREPADGKYDSLQQLNLVLHATGMDTALRVPIRTVPDSSKSVQVGPVQRTCPAYAEDEGEAAAAWLTQHLNKELKDGDEKKQFRLVWIPPGGGRILAKDPRYGPLMAPTDSTAFADTAQLHITNSASLVALNTQLEKQGSSPVGMDRFRCNIVVGGGEVQPWEEDHWRCVAFQNSIKFRVCMPDLRCNVTTISQSGPTAGRRDPEGEPLKTLKILRRCELRRGAVFGVKLNIIKGSSGAVIRVGDPFSVTSRTRESMMALNLDKLKFELLPTTPALL